MKVVMVWSSTSEYFDLFSVDVSTVDVSSFSFIVVAAPTGRQITVMNLPGAACPFI